MAQRAGIYKILSNSLIYETIQALFYHEPTTLQWRELIGPNIRGDVLDVGCGTGVDAYKFFSDSRSYVGIDVSEEYIKTAKRHYGDYGTFYKADVNNLRSLNLNKFNLITLKGVLHHLSDKEALKMLTNLKSLLADDGFIATIDPTFVVGRPLANKLVSLDRGMHIRDTEKILSLCGDVFGNIQQRVIKQNFPPYQRILLSLAP